MSDVGWVQCKLGDQITLQRGKDITKGAAIEGPVPVISSGGVSFMHNEPWAKGPGVLLGRKGSVGNVHYVEEDYWPHDTTLYIKDFKGNLPRFVYYFFKRFPISQYEASAANPSLNRNNLHPVQVNWPPLPEQRRIAAILDKADEVRRKRAEAIRLTEELLKSAFLEMFGDPVTNPKGWGVRKLGEVCSFVGGGTPARARPEFFTGEIAWATSKDIKGEVFVDSQEHVTEEAIARSATKLVPAGTLLIVVKSKVLMHRLPMTISTVAVCFGQDLKGIVLDHPDLRPEYVLRLLKLSSGVLLPQARGANTEGLTLDHLRNLDIFWPPANLIVRYQALSNRVRSILQKNTLRQMDSLVATLTQRAFRGEL